MAGKITVRVNHYFSFRKVVSRSDISKNKKAYNIVIGFTYTVFCILGVMGNSHTQCSFLLSRNLRLF